jgi:hypothetical protein
MVRLVLVLLVLAVLAVVADRVAVRVVQDVVAARVQSAGALPAAPAVEVRGFPFLTQALRGRYDDVVVRASRVPAGTLTVESFVAQLSGVRVPLSDAVQGTVTSVPVDGLTARAVLTYADMTAAVAERGLRVTAAGGGLVRVTGSLRVLGRELEASAVSRATLEGGEVVLTAERFEVGNAAADALVSRALGDRLDVRVAVGELPYGLALTGVRVGGDGVLLDAQAAATVLAPR